MMEKLAMGNYGAYVWSSFALMVFVIVICVIQARSSHRRIYRDIETRLKAMDSAHE